jgi:hypothetical protein
MATFVPLRKGICDDIRSLIPMAGEGNVRLETFSEQHVDREAMCTVLDQPSHKVYTGVKFRQGSPWQWVYLWLACVLPGGLSRMPGQRPGFTPHFAWGSMATLDGDTLAYLTVREGQDADGGFWEIGVIGHGPRAAGLAQQVAAAIGEWARDYGNDAPAPTFRMATDATRELLKGADPRFIIDKRRTYWIETPAPLGAPRPNRDHGSLGARTVRDAWGAVVGGCGAVISRPAGRPKFGLERVCGTPPQHPSRCPGHGLRLVGLQRPPGKATWPATHLFTCMFIPSTRCSTAPRRSGSWPPEPQSWGCPPSR